MPVRVILVNEGLGDLKITFMNSQRFDLVVRDTVGHEVFKWSVGKVFIQMIEEVNLEQGQGIEDELVWEADVSPGTYSIVGMTPPVVVEGRALVIKSSPVFIQVQL